MNIYELVMGNWDLNNVINAVIRIAVSGVIGVCIGWERKNHQQIVGIRTLLLICLSSTLLGILSEFAALSTPGAKGDPGRIAAAVITGIGFVGGGAIMHRGFNIKGVTTAALIWATAAIGLAIGYGLFIPAIIVFIFILVSLPLFQRVEMKFFPSDKIRLLSLSYSAGKVDFAKVKECLKERGILLKEISIKDDIKKELQKLDIFVFASSDIDVFDLNNALKNTGDLLKFSYSDT